MPTPAAFSHALILNDFMRIRDALPDRLGAVELNRAQYYAGCLNDYAKVAARGITDRNEDLDVLLAALERESDEVRRDVEAMPVYRRAVQYRTQGRLDLKTKVATKVQTMSSDPPPSFDTVFAAMAWDAANPRTPVAESFLDVLPMIDTETVPARKHRPQGRAERPDPGPGPKGTSRPAAPRPLNALRARLRLRSRIARLTRGA